MRAISTRLRSSHEIADGRVRNAIAQMRQEMEVGAAVDRPSAFWKEMGEVNERILDWSGEANFKRTLNQNYFNFIPIAADDARMVACADWRAISQQRPVSMRSMIRIATPAHGYPFIQTITSSRSRIVQTNWHSSGNIFP